MSAGRLRHVSVDQLRWLLDVFTRRDPLRHFDGKAGGRAARMVRAQLFARGLLDADGRLTEGGRAAVERETRGIAL